MDIKTLQAAFAPKQASGSRFYPFWKMNPGETVIVRFLPDADTSNPMGFLIENLTHTLNINGQRKIVPCLSMYGENCPICNHSRKLYDAGDNVNGKKYYKKKEYIGQVLVISSPFEYDVGENPIKLISFGPQLFKTIQSQFMSGDLDEVPCDFDNGYDFKIMKTQQGEYASYAASAFARKSTPVDPAIRPHLQLMTLKDQRTQHQSYEVLNALLLSDLTGAAVDGDSTGGGEPQDEGDEMAAAPAAVAPTPAQNPAVQAAEPAPPKRTAAEILAEIRAKNAAKAAA